MWIWGFVSDFNSVVSTDSTEGWVSVDPEEGGLGKGFVQTLDLSSHFRLN